MKKYNFNAGPSILPREVIENTAKQILDFNGSGLSLMEISHRAKDFQPVVDEAVRSNERRVGKECHIFCR